MFIPKKWRGVLRICRRLALVIDEGHLEIIQEVRVAKFLKQQNAGIQPEGVSEEKLDKIRLLVAERHTVKLDAYGRFRIPAELRRRIGLKREVIAVGMLDRMQLWEPKRYKDACSKMGNTGS
jgi:DNA-binding transcriptional regulator/RsmH inhibitor MraZ